MDECFLVKLVKSMCEENFDFLEKLESLAFVAFYITVCADHVRTETFQLKSFPSVTLLYSGMEPTTHTVSHLCAVKTAVMQYVTFRRIPLYFITTFLIFHKFLDLMTSWRLELAVRLQKLMFASFLLPPCRRFEESHVGQIKTVFPVAYTFRQEKNIPTFNTSIKKGSYQLTVEPVILSG